MEDSIIIELLRNNSPDGLRTLITKYRGLVGKIASGLLVNHNEDIEEVIDDTFISIWKNSAHLDAKLGSLKGLLIITARNHAINRWRKLKKENLVNIEDTADLYDDDFDVLNQLIAREDAHHLQLLINTLPEPNKEIFVRRHYFLESVKTIAASTDMDVKQVSNTLYQSKLRLRENALKEE